MNGFEGGRDVGIDLFFRPIRGMIYPNLLRDKNIDWEDRLLLDCPDQGHFYGGIEIY